MREPGEVVSAAFPRPGRALKGVLVLLAACAILGAVIVNLLPGRPTGPELFKLLTFDPEHPERAWAFLTSGLLTSPEGFTHALWSLLGLYFLGVDLEKRWGGPRLLRFLATSVVAGNLAVLGASHLGLSHPLVHPAYVFGPTAAIAAVSIAWGRENATRQIRLFFFLPISGRILAWATVGFAVLAVLFNQPTPEGIVAPFGGILAGLVLGGSPSPVRSAWLRLKLALLRRQGNALTVESLTGEPPSDRPRPSKRGAKRGPPLAILPGGLDDDLKNRKPPKDKRYLN